MIHLNTQSNCSNHWSSFAADGTANLEAAAQVILDQIQILASPPTNARSFLVTDVYGRGVHTPEGDVMVQTMYPGLATLRVRDHGRDGAAPRRVRGVQPDLGRGARRGPGGRGVWVREHDGRVHRGLHDPGVHNGWDGYGY